MRQCKKCRGRFNQGARHFCKVENRMIEDDEDDFFILVSELVEGFHDVMSSDSSDSDDGGGGDGD